MKVRVTFDLTEADRIAIAALTGKVPIAPREMVTFWISMTVKEQLADIGAEHASMLAPYVPDDDA